MKIVILLFVSTLFLPANLRAESDHDHDHDHAHEESHDDHEEGHSENNEHAHGGEDHHGHDEGSFGEGKAIVSVKDGGKKFRLSSESIAFLEVKTKELSTFRQGNSVLLSRDLLIEYQNQVGVFITKDGWFELLEVEILNESEKNNQVTLKLPDHPKDSEIAVSPLGVLRAAHLQASGQGGHGHAH